MKAISNKEANRKIAIYKALRTVKDKINKGQLQIIDDDGRPMFKEFVFLLARVDHAIILAEDDEVIDEIKDRLDQQVPLEARNI